jgi:hypothetical protein
MGLWRPSRIETTILMISRRSIATKWPARAEARSPAGARADTGSIDPRIRPSVPFPNQNEILSIINGAKTPFGKTGERSVKGVFYQWNTLR